MDLQDRKFFTIYYLIVTSLVLIIAILMPEQSWDKLGYAGAALSLSGADTDTIHSTVYRELRETAHPDDYEALTTGDYHEGVTIDPQAFGQQLPLYNARLLYIALIYLLSNLGVGLLFSTHLISAVAVFIALWLFHFTYHRFIDVRLLYLLPIFWIAMNVVGIARLSTPDGLVFLSIAFCLFLLMRRSWLLLLALPLCVLVKPSLLLFALLVLAYMFIQFNAWRILIIVAALAAVGLYFYTSRQFGGYGWETLIYFVFFGRPLYPEDADIAISAADYSKILRWSVLNLWFDRLFWLYLGLVAVLSSTYWYVHKKRSLLDHEENQIIHVMIILFLYILIHFLVFPVIVDRYFAAPYYVTVLALLVILTAGYPQLSAVSTAATVDAG